MIGERGVVSDTPHPSESDEIRALRRVIANAIERSDGEPYTEIDDVYLLNADAVIVALDLCVCCSVCGLTAEHCTGQDHSDYAHDYDPLVYVGADLSGRAEP